MAHCRKVGEFRGCGGFGVEDVRLFAHDARVGYSMCIPLFHELIRTSGMNIYLNERRLHNPAEDFSASLGQFAGQGLTSGN